MAATFFSNVEPQVKAQGDIYHLTFSYELPDGSRASTVIVMERPRAWFLGRLLYSRAGVDADEQKAELVRLQAAQ